MRYHSVVGSPLAQRYRRLRKPHPSSTRELMRRRLASCLGGIGACALLAVTLFLLRSDHIAGCREEDMQPLHIAATTVTTAQDSPKTAYLTFDDGPSENTVDILEILRQNEIHASFFVIAAENNEIHLPVLQQTLADGNCIGLHTCTHEYRQIYAGTAAYWDDIDTLKEKLQPYCADYSYRALRFPGGSTNTVSHKFGGSGLMKDLIAQAAEKGYLVVDWNVSAEDAVGGNPSPQTIASRVIKGCKDKNTVIILMHDSSANDATVQALPTIIQWLKESGYTFDTVDNLPAS